MHNISQYGGRQLPTHVRNAKGGLWIDRKRSNGPCVQFMDVEDMDAWIASMRESYTPNQLQLFVNRKVLTVRY